MCQTSITPAGNYGAKLADEKKFRAPGRPVPTDSVGRSAPRRPTSTPSARGIGWNTPLLSRAPTCARGGLGYLRNPGAVLVRTRTHHFAFTGALPPETRAARDHRQAPQTWNAVRDDRFPGLGDAAMKLKGTCCSRGTCGVFFDGRAVRLRRCPDGALPVPVSARNASRASHEQEQVKHEALRAAWPCPAGNWATPPSSAR
jgi:hypothetical protein